MTCRRGDLDALRYSSPEVRFVLFSAHPEIVSSDCQETPLSTSRTERGCQTRDVLPLNCDYATKNDDSFQKFQAKPDKTGDAVIFVWKYQLHHWEHPLGRRLSLRLSKKHQSNLIWINMRLHENNWNFNILNLLLATVVCDLIMFWLWRGYLQTPIRNQCRLTGNVCSREVTEGFENVEIVGSDAVVEHFWIDSSVGRQWPCGGILQ